MESFEGASDNKKSASPQKKQLLSSFERVFIQGEFV